MATSGPWIYAIGGEGNGQAYSRVDALDTRSGAWARVDGLDTPRHSSGAVVCRDNIYIAAGSTIQGGKETNAFDVLDVDSDGVDCGLAWSRAADSPTFGSAGQGGRSEAAAGSVNDRDLYAFGGYTSWNPWETTAANASYDFKTDSWDQSAADMPRELQATHIATASDGRYVYTAGGYQHECGVGILGTFGCPSPHERVLDAVGRFDPATNTWSSLPSLPEARGSGGLVLVGRTLHFIGGTDAGVTEDESTRIEKGDHWTLDLDDPTRWVDTGKPLPTPRSHFSAVSLGGDIYIIGGQHGAATSAVALKAVDRFDGSDWSTAPSLPDPLSHMSASTFAVAGHIVVAGGENGHNDYTNKVWDFNPATGDWAALTSIPRTAPASAGDFYADRIVLSGGGGDFRRATWTGTYE